MNYVLHIHRLIQKFQNKRIKLNLSAILEDSAKAKKENETLLKVLKNKKSQKVDELFHEAHQKVFACTDCLKCANCCKTTGPKFTDRDVDRISKHLSLKPSVFIQKYLRIDEDNDQVLQSVPCVFLAPDNYCLIYDVRPKACREYPHTDRVNQYQLLKLHLKNTEICPAVLDVFKEVKSNL